MEAICPFCGVTHALPQAESQFNCACGAYGSLHIKEDAYLFLTEAAKVLGLNPAEFVEGAGYQVIDHPNRFMELKNSGIVFTDNAGDEFVLQWAKRLQ